MKHPFQIIYTQWNDVNVMFHLNFWSGQVVTDKNK